MNQHPQKKIFEKAIQREMNILRLLDSPYTIKLEQIYRSKKKLHIVMEYCDGGPIYDILVN